MVKLPEHKEISQPDLTNRSGVLCPDVLYIGVALSRWGYLTVLLPLRAQALVFVHVD